MKLNLCSLCDTLKLKVKGFYITHIQIPLAYWWTSKLRILSDFDSIQYVLDERCSIDGKFVQEVVGGNRDIWECDVPKYLEQIIFELS